MRFLDTLKNWFTTKPVSGRKKNRPSQKIQVEGLETRSLMAAGITPGVALSNGLLEINGTANNDTVVVARDTNNRIMVTMNGKVTKFNAIDVDNIRFHGYEGNDNFDNQTAINSMAWGGEGNDDLRGGNGVDYLFGGAGHDRLHGRTGDDFLYGENGNDILLGQGGRNYLDGGKGDDTLDGGADKFIDTLIGGFGADYFNIETKKPGTTSVDITDFNFKQDLGKKLT